MDLRMPGVDGLEATRRIRATETPGGPRTVIAAVTASALDTERDELARSGADVVLSKPFPLEAVLDVLARHLGVRYVYADGQRDDGPRAALTAARLQALSSLDARRLRDALVGGDVTRAEELARQLGGIDETLREALLGEITAYRLDEVASLLEARLDLA
jgi:DNA-binding response OmpR family regulator